MSMAGYRPALIFQIIRGKYTGSTPVLPPPLAGSCQRREERMIYECDCCLKVIKAVMCLKINEEVDGMSYTGSTPALGAGRLGSIPSIPKERSD